MTLYDITSASNTCHTQTNLQIHSEFLAEEDDNFYTANEFVNQLFTEKSRLLIIRVDFGLHGYSKFKYDAEYIREAMQRMLNNKRGQSNLFGNCVGYLWGLELGSDKGFHYHCFFFYDGAQSQQDQSIGHGIGRYWMQITNHEGTYYCSNDDKHQFEIEGKCGIGMINRCELTKRQQLSNLLGYLFKDTNATKLALNGYGLKRFRLFGKGR